MTDAPNDAPNDSDEEYFPEFRTVRRGYDPEQVEEVLDEILRELGVFVHLADERPDPRLGKFPDAVAEDPLVFGKHGQGLGKFGSVLGHGGILLQMRPKR